MSERLRATLEQGFAIGVLRCPACGSREACDCTWEQKVAAAKAEAVELELLVELLKQGDDIAGEEDV